MIDEKDGNAVLHRNPRLAIRAKPGENTRQQRLTLDGTIIMGPWGRICEPHSAASRLVVKNDESIHLPCNPTALGRPVRSPKLEHQKRTHELAGGALCARISPVPPVPRRIHGEQAIVWCPGLGS